MLGSIVYFLLVLHDTLNDWIWLKTPYLGPIGFVGILFSQGAFLSQLYNRDYLRAEALTVSLQKINQELEMRVLERIVSLQESNRQLQGMLSFKEKVSQMVVHDLKNPLSVILTSLDSTQIQADQLRYYIRQSCQRMIQLIQNLLDIQKMEDQRLVVQLQPLSLHALVKHSLELYEPWRQSRRLYVELDIPEGLKVTADAALLERVLLNLISNAFKALPEYGQLVISAQLAGAEIILDIQDQGSGIAPELLEHLFEPFVSGESKTSPIAGSGLGLTFCKFAIELMQGRLQIKSEPGSGTLVSIWLPSAEPHHVRESGLQTQDLLQLMPFLEQLDALKVYQNSAIHEVLTEISRVPSLENARIESWLQQLQQSIDQFDQDAYHQTLQVALKRPDSHR